MAMKLILSIVQDEDANQLADALRENGFSSTKISSTGGFLRRGSSTFMVGIDEAAVSTVLDLIKLNCRSRTQPVDPFVFMEPEYHMSELIEVQVGGAVSLVLDVERLVRV